MQQQHAEVLAEINALAVKPGLRARFVTWLRGTPESLPDTLVKLVEDQRQASERLVSWLQLAIVMVIGLYYLEVPRASLIEGTISFAMPLLAIYIVFTVVRLALAGEKKMSAAVEVVSIVLDVALVMGFIWTTHVENAQPAASYLKSSTVLYVFVIIALRTLTYAPWQVLLAGTAAVAGWTGLLLYAITATGAERLLTSDYGVYETTAAVHFGAELEKMSAILVVTVLLAFVAGRARTVMLRSLYEHHVATRLSRFFEPEIAQNIKDSIVMMEPGQGRNVECAAMFIDLKGFTGIAAKMTPAAVLELLARYHSQVVPIIHANNGSVSSYVGDGILATFGAFNVNHGTYAADAMRAAEQIIEVFRRWNIERISRKLPLVGVGFGIEAGAVIVGVVGEGQRLQYTVIGTPVNYASKFQSHTRKDNVSGIVTHTCFKLAQHQGYKPTTEQRLAPAQRVRGVGPEVDLVIFP